jgi:hypothetical protein
MRREEFLFTLLDRTRLDDGVNKKTKTQTISTDPVLRS